MTKKIALAAALVHSPRVLVLDEPFESVDPVSAANIRDILARFAQGGGTVVVSSHSMDLVERMCDHVAIVAGGRVLVAGTMDDVRGESDLETRFLELIGGRRKGGGPALVGTLLRLRFRVLANTLARNPFQLVAVILGGLLARLMLLLADRRTPRRPRPRRPRRRRRSSWSAARHSCWAGSSCRCCSTAWTGRSIRPSSRGFRCAPGS
jgi:hypothetical protein